jgi:hypothetical protein
MLGPTMSKAKKERIEEQPTAYPPLKPFCIGFTGRVMPLHQKPVHPVSAAAW